jgi:hypothetical protein
MSVRYKSALKMIQRLVDTLYTNKPFVLLQLLETVRTVKRL